MQKKKPPPQKQTNKQNNQGFSSDINFNVRRVVLKQLSSHRWVRIVFQNTLTGYEEAIFQLANKQI